MEFRIKDNKARKILGILRKPLEVFSGSAGLASLPFLEVVSAEPASGAEGKSQAEPASGAEAATNAKPSVAEVLALIDEYGIKPSLDAFSAEELLSELALREKSGFAPEELTPVVERLKGAFENLAAFNSENGSKATTWNGAATLVLSGKATMPV